MKSNSITMKVHITSIPGYPKEKIEQITSLLNELKGEIQYFACDPLDQDQMTLIDNKFQHIDEITLLSFDDFFNIASKFRIFRSISKDDIVVVLTTIGHSFHWFSGTSNRNIFVDTRGWEYITDNDLN